MVAADIRGVFLNPADFGFDRELDGQTVVCVAEDESGIALGSDATAQAIAQGVVVLWFEDGSVDDREAGAILNIDGVEAEVRSWRRSMGMVRVEVWATRGI
jgi:hypothetical protein